MGVCFWIRRSSRAAVEYKATPHSGKDAREKFDWIPLFLSPLVVHERERESRRLFFTPGVLQPRLALFLRLLWLLTSREDVSRARPTFRVCTTRQLSPPPPSFLQALVYFYYMYSVGCIKSLATFFLAPFARVTGKKDTWKTISFYFFSIIFLFFSLAWSSFFTK